MKQIYQDICNDELDYIFNFLDIKKTGNVDF